MAYKLTYLDMKGRAECVRLMLTVAGVPFEDVRLKMDEWEKFKPTTPWGQVPVLDIGDKRLAQTLTICRYLGRKYNLCGDDDWESAKCDELVDASNDLMESWAKFTFFEQDKDKKAQMKHEFISTTAPKYLSKFNALQPQSGGKFLIGKNLTWADVKLADVFQVIEDTVDSTILDPFPNLKAFKATVFAEPILKEYIERTDYNYKSLGGGS